MRKQGQLSMRLRAMFLMGAIGDALGAPVEIMTKDAIRERYGRLTEFVADPHHRFGPIAAGETTDDTQLKLAIARSIARMRGIDLDDIAWEHVAELWQTTRGWGGSTTRAVKKLEEGVHWSISGICADPSQKQKGLGKGNGVAMKIDPVAVYFATRCIHPLSHWRHRCAIKNIAMMTHATDMGVAQAYAQVAAIYYALTSDVVFTRDFSATVTHAALLGEQEFPSTEGCDRLSDRLRLLGEVTSETTDEVLREKFGTGACYVYESLPLAYALFLRKPNSIDALYDAVNWGGDTDTVASIVGSLLGALNGRAIVPFKLAYQIDRHHEILEVADQLERAFNISIS